MIGNLTVNLLKASGLYPSPWMLRIQIFLSFFSISYRYINIIIENLYFRKKPIRLDIYFIIDLIQCEGFFLLQIYFYRSVHNSKKFYDRLENYISKMKIDRKVEKKVFLMIFIIIIVRILKYMVTFTNFPFSFSYFTQSILPEISIVMNDLFFVSLIENLSYNIKYRKSLILRRKSINKQIFNLIKIEKQIMKRFHKVLLITIFYNYLMLIVCLYWMFIRITFFKFRFFYGKKL